MNRLKLTVGVALLLVACVWLAYQGYTSAKTYYMTVAELLQSPEQAEGKSLRVGGDVKPGSIQKADQLRFDLMQGPQVLSVLYVGNDTIPDTFNDHAQAVVDGRYDKARKIFLADKIQAKCASKYESKGPRKLSSFAAPKTTMGN